MARIVRRPRARQDLVFIWRYIADESGEARADRYLRRLNDVISLLAQQPLIGRRRPEIEEGILSFVAESHLIFYIALTDGIELVRVIHGSQDLEKAWSEERD